MDLLFKNAPYFVSTYLDFPLWQYLVAFVCCTALLILFLRFVLKFSIKKSIVLSIVFGTYFALFIGMTLLGNSRAGVRGVYLDPLYGIKKIFIEDNVHFLRGMLSNALLFVPFGVFYVLVSKKPNVLIGLALSVGLSFVIECLQYILLLGYAEANDVISNVFGAFVGVLIALFIKKLLNKLSKKSDKIQGEK